MSQCQYEVGTGVVLHIKAFRNNVQIPKANYTIVVKAGGSETTIPGSALQLSSEPGYEQYYEYVHVIQVAVRHYVVFSCTNPAYVSVQSFDVALPY